MATPELVGAITRLLRQFPPHNPYCLELNEALTFELSQKPRNNVTAAPTVTASVTHEINVVDVTGDTPEAILGPAHEAIIAALDRIGFALLPKRPGAAPGSPKPKRDMAAYMRARRAKQRAAKGTKPNATNA